MVLSWGYNNIRVRWYEGVRRIGVFVGFVEDIFRGEEVFRG